LRHDVDTAECVRNLPILLELDRKSGMSASVSVRMDGLDYDPAGLSAVVREFSGSDFEFGVHTSCYLSEDFLAAFRVETARFAELYGAAPRSFTVHGLGEHRIDVRNRFVEEIRDRLGEFGYDFTDADPLRRQYRYVLQDCNIDPADVRRVLYDEFLRLPPLFERGFDYLVLTHPCYWEAAG
jgi:hypothetical protein